MSGGNPLINFSGIQNVLQQIGNNINLLVGAVQKVNGPVAITGSPAAGQYAVWSGNSSITGEALTESIPFYFNGNGTTLTNSTKAYLSNVPFSGAITGWTLLGDNTGSVTVGVWKTPYASAPPTLGTQQKNSSTTLTGWSTAVTAGDVVVFQITGVSTVTQLSGALQVTRS